MCIIVFCQITVKKTNGDYDINCFSADKEKHLNQIFDHYFLSIKNLPSQFENCHSITGNFSLNKLNTFISFFRLFYKMRAGAPSLNIRNFTITDNSRSRAPQSITSGWFYVRVLEAIPKERLADLSSNHGIKFESTDMISSGWFKKYFNEQQVGFCRSSGLFALFPLKNYDKPDFNKLRNLPELLVIATDGWNPTPPARIKGKMFTGTYIVEGATAEQLFQDPLICKIDEVPKARLL
ncbi:hypothetical protein TRFO_13178 [Tritrichomonas foetus]|uniref:Uncharacterized protein n=1 Tax=Tritrichomonas foetus TaxID=1144522 RepID=A0A1J4KZ93_9EUKA|nr:hypothetical protein TRFO_13178 [Tritrichomonas foetus]|eukprot:OHT16571.1 hypothetical protein TRFO_13178 [Tritrichomonas foetus]